MSRQFHSQQGFLTLAINSNTTDYLRLAYLQALNIKATQKIKNVSVIVDRDTMSLVTDKHRQVFDHIIPTTKLKNPYANEWHAWWLTPYKETLKVESDLLFTRSIDHWWDAFRLHDVCMSHGCRNYKQEISDVRKYRQVFDANSLPDVYNGLMYFRYSETSRKFFDRARYVFEHWDLVKQELKNCDTDATTDLVYAIVASMMEEPCYNPSMDFINFVHMKSGIQGWSDDNAWDKYCVHGIGDNIIHINNINQIHPVHYYNKDYATDELIEYYEQRIS